MEYTEHQLALLQGEVITQNGIDESKLHMEQQQLHEYSIILEMSHQMVTKVEEDEIKWGDINSRYSHSLAVRRWQHNGIYQLKLDDGSKIEGQEEIGLALT